ncbi:MAG: alpha/beta hydrolase [Lewinellaceae bacterium]|nr:alpha/beta hydrolase [Saprospiraceae bacterium]MCB9344914.1 alpha/beta hydrolase [Lewinellaceae bacterium]
MKSPIIFLHGALGCANNFEPLLSMFPEDQPVYAIDLPGHGSKQPDEAFSLQLFSDSILKFLDEKQFDKVIIFGYSMGGYAALNMAAKWPNKIEKVITLGTKLAWNPEVAAGMVKIFNPEVIEAKVPKFAAMLDAAHADWKTLCRYTTAFLLDLGNGLGIQEADFRNISCPVTIGWGSEDNVVSKEESLHVAQLISLGNFVELESTKHQLELVDLNILFKFVEKALKP